MKKCLLTLFILGLFFTPGCRESKIKGLVPVKGVITYKNEPLENAAVCFTPKDFKTGDRIGTGKTDAQGRFVLRTIGEPGVLPGEYVVVVIKNDIIPGKSSSKSPNPRPATSEVKSAIPKRYGDPKMSDVSIIVGKEGLRNWKLEIAD